MNKVKIYKRGLSVLREMGVRVSLAAICLAPLLFGVSVMLCGDYEKAQGSILPRYLWNDEELIRKHLFTMSPGLNFLADRYGAPELEGLESFRSCANVLAPMARQMQAGGMRVEGMVPAVRDFNDYKISMDPGRMFVPDLIVKRMFHNFVEKKYSVSAEEMLTSIRNSRDIPPWLINAFPDEAERMTIIDSLETLTFAIMNNDLGASYMRFDEVPVPVQSAIRPARWRTPDTAEWRLWADFIRGLPGQYKWMPTAEVYWRDFLRQKYQGDIGELNRRWSSAWKSFSEIPFDRAAYLVPPCAEDWAGFIRFSWPREMMHLAEGYDDNWREFLKERSFDYSGLLPGLMLGGDDEVQAELVLPLMRPEDPAMDVLWCDFVESAHLPLAAIKLVTHAEQFGPFQRAQYLGGMIVSLNEEWKTSYQSFSELVLPLGLNDLSIFPRDAAELRKEYRGEAWYTALKGLEYPRGVLSRTARTVGAMVFASMILSVCCGYILARIPVAAGGSLSVAAIAALLVPVPTVLLAYGITLTESLGDYRWVISAMVGVNAFSVLIMRGCFLDIVKRYREESYLDGVGEAGFIFKFVLRYSWLVILYMFVLHLLVVYCVVDWQILANGRLWSWTLGVWAIDQAGTSASLKAAVAILGMLPVLITAVLTYPLFSRYCLMPILRTRSGGGSR